MIDTDMTHERCDAVVRAVDKIDSAVGFELFQVPTEIPLTDLPAYGGHSEVVLVGADRLQPGILGLTGYKVTDLQPGGWLAAEIIVFDISIWNDPLAADSVVLHELLHAVGAEHAAQEGAWESVMRPGWTPGAPIELTAADLAALRAAYFK